MSFQQGLSGLNAASKSLDVIGNNVANTNTIGYKQSRAEFSDVYAASLSGAGSTNIGLGTQVAAVTQQFTQGNITASNNPMDVAINGRGFFRMSQNGAISYTRNGQFQVDKNNYIVDSRGLQLTGFALDPITGVINTSTPAPLKLDTGDQPPLATGTATTNQGISAQLNLDSRNAIIAAPFNFQDPSTFNQSTSLAIYDSQGNPYSQTLYFKKTATNTWNVYSTVTNPLGNTISVPDPTDQTVALTKLVFKTNGTILSGGTVASLTVPADPGVGTPANFIVLSGADIVFPVSFAGTSQYGASFGVNALSQDGYSSGKLTGIAIGSDGFIKGRYTNGQSKDLGQVTVTNFQNPQGLQPLGNNQWAETSASGNAVPVAGVPGTGSLGVLQASAVEDSNVDLTAELVNMITAQRVYQANAQTIKTQDAVLQTLVNLR